jgi:uncharacterized protein YggL (DUF469 family)
MARRFTVLTDFFCDELQTQYLANYSYDAGDNDELLNDLLDEWIANGWAREGGPSAELSGQGETDD